MSIQKQVPSPKKSRTRIKNSKLKATSVGSTAVAVSPTVLPAKKSGRHFAFLVAVDQRREKTRAYAIMAPSAEAALERMAMEAFADVGVSLVGCLSRDMARRLKLKAGEMLLLSA